MSIISKHKQSFKNKWGYVNLLRSCPSLSSTLQEVGLTDLQIGQNTKVRKHYL